MTSSAPDVYAGIDTHRDTHHVAVIDGLGRQLGDQEFSTTAHDHQRLLIFLQDFGTLQRVGIEGTGSYGAGVTAYLREQQVLVKEVIRPNRQARRQGKSDPIDAYAAARAVAADNDLPVPKLAGGRVNDIRVTLKTRNSAVKARSAAIAQIKSYLITAPTVTRETYEPLANDELIATLIASRPRPGQTVKRVLRRLAVRCEYLTEEITAAEEELEALNDEVAPELTQAQAVGAVTGAQMLVTAGGNPERIKSKAAFAALCGVNPIPASSGKVQRHRLNRGGDRQANWALHRIVMVRMGNDERTKRYYDKRIADGKTKREIMRCLKRYVANEIFTLIVNPDEVPKTDDLRALRQQQKLTLKHVAEQFNVWPAAVSKIERGKRRDDHFVTTYRKFLLQTA